MLRDKAVPRVESTRLLGVITDSHLTSEHIQKVQRYAAISIETLGVLAKTKPFSYVTNVMNAFVSQHIDAHWIWFQAASCSDYFDFRLNLIHRTFWFDFYSHLIWILSQNCFWFWSILLLNKNQNETKAESERINLTQTKLKSNMDKKDFGWLLMDNRFGGLIMLEQPLNFSVNRGLFFKTIILDIHVINLEFSNKETMITAANKIPTKNPVKSKHTTCEAAHSFAERNWIASSAHQLNVWRYG